MHNPSDRLFRPKNWYDPHHCGEVLPSANLDLKPLILENKGKVGSGEPV